MTTLKHTEFNLQTGETIVRDYTDKDMLAVSVEEARIAALLVTQAEAEAAKTAAQAKLAALGLTTDDLKALGLGGN